MEIIVKIINLIIAMAAVVLILMGAASGSPAGKYFFIGGIALFLVAAVMRFMTLLFYSK